MPEFITLLPPHQALEQFLNELSPEPIFEKVNTAEALGRVTAEDVTAPHPLPSFRRSTVDGYAVKAKDTHGASESLPTYLVLAGEVPMGGAADFDVGDAQCALIHTGGMLPKGTDAVVMVEYTQSSRPNEVEILRSAAMGENVLAVGEDVKEGEAVISAGCVLRPAEIGGLMALGYTTVQVSKRPKVGIISSGDEVLSPDKEIKPGQVRDVNTYTLSALVEQTGGEAVPYGIVGDRLEEMEAVVKKADTECDLVVITAGSSASARDLTAEVINKLGEPGVLVHGVNVRPGKPTILGVCEGKPVIGLPGNPVSALVIAGLFVVPVVESLLGLDKARPKPKVSAELKINLASQAGREDWVAVRLVETSKGFEAEPIFGKSNLIFTLAKADGLIQIPADATGLSIGEMVDVWYL